MDFDEFTRRADPYFAEDLLSDVRLAMPGLELQDLGLGRGRFQWRRVL